MATYTAAASTSTSHDCSFSTAFLHLQTNFNDIPSLMRTSFAWISLRLPYDVFILCLLCLLTLVVWRQRSQKYRKLPPGPQAGLFGLGDNRAQISQVTHAWRRYTAWSKHYGPIFAYYLGGTPVIVLGTAQAAWDLLEKRGEKYSNRPRQIMVQELLSGSMRGIGMSYGDRWKKWRKIQHVGMSGRQATTYKPLQMLESSILMRDIVETPDKYNDHLRRFAVSIVFSISYGTRVRTAEDQIVKDNAYALAPTGRYMKPGEYLVESYPILLRLPRALQWFRREPDMVNSWTENMYLRLLRGVAAKMKDGTAKESASSRVLSPGQNMGMSEVELAWAVSAPFAAGVGTTRASIIVFILAMLHNPQVAEKAHEEIDTVVGRDRMPTFDDEKSLPYVVALVKEVTRWRSIAPTGVAHSTAEDDYYQGFFIPKGATIYANIFDMMHDPEMFADPDAFKPERFLETNNPRLVDFNLPFGFGRRICPGQHVATQSLFIAIVRLLWAFNIEPVLGPDGKPLLPDPNAFIGSLVIEPAPFTCTFIPRYPDVEEIIQAEALDAHVQLKAWE